MAAELERTLSGQVGEITLIPSSGGVFEVMAGEKLIFSKRQSRRFPAPGEVEKALSGESA